jgi:hypothetical protein
MRFELPTDLPVISRLKLREPFNGLSHLLGAFLGVAALVALACLARQAVAPLRLRGLRHNGGSALPGQRPLRFPVMGWLIVIGAGPLTRPLPRPGLHWHVAALS